MNNLLTATIASFICAISVNAQSFNTITDARPHYKVKQTHVDMQVSKTTHDSSIDSSAVLNTDTIPKKVDKNIEDYRYPLAVSCPLNKSKLVVSSPYGYRRHPILGVRKFHQGVDLRAKTEPVYAMFPGVVVKTGYDNISGNFITLQHASMRISYCHLSAISVSKGATVYAGQPLGITGSTGCSTGVHLHLTLKIDGQPCNPMPLLRFVEQQGQKTYMAMNAKQQAYHLDRPAAIITI